MQTFKTKNENIFTSFNNIASPFIIKNDKVEKQTPNSNNNLQEITIGIPQTHSQSGLGEKLFNSPIILPKKISGLIKPIINKKASANNYPKKAIFIKNYDSHNFGILELQNLSHPLTPLKNEDKLPNFHHSTVFNDSCHKKNEVCHKVCISEGQRIQFQQKRSE